MSFSPTSGEDAFSIWAAWTRGATAAPYNLPIALVAASGPRGLAPPDALPPSGKHDVDNSLTPNDGGAERGDSSEPFQDLA